MKKILVLLLAILLLSACAAKKEEKKEEVVQAELKEASYYLSALENFAVGEKNKNNTVDNKDFDAFLEDVFNYYVEHDYLEMRAFLLDYQSFGITKPEVSWGHFKYQDYSKAEYYNQKLEEIKKFDYASLSYDQQYEYDSFVYFSLENILSCFYKEYDSLFSQGIDTIDFVYFNLDEFVLNDQECLDDFMILLKDAGRYLLEALDFTLAQTQNSIYPSDGEIDYSCAYIDELLASDDNMLVNSFNKKLDGVEFISNEKKQQYKADALSIYENDLVPALNTIKEKLSALKDVNDEAASIINLDAAKYHIYYKSSSNKSINELFNGLLEDIVVVIDNYKFARSDEDTLEDYAACFNKEKYPILFLDDIGMLNFLEENIFTMVPELKDIEYTISRLDAASEGSSVIAYHLKPAVDNPQGTIIRTNPNAMGANVLDDYTVIAHEGIPGHMYQNLYYMASNPNLITNIYSYIGYKEGWATYSMLEALDLLGVSKGTKDIETYSWIMNYYLCALGDIAFNYYGYDIDTFGTILDEHGLNSALSQAIYNVAKTNGGTNLSYALGYLEFSNLRKLAENSLGEKFNEIDFHKVLIEHGPIPIVLLEDAVNSYIAENK